MPFFPSMPGVAPVGAPVGAPVDALLKYVGRAAVHDQRKPAFLPVPKLAQGQATSA